MAKRTSVRKTRPAARKRGRRRTMRLVLLGGGGHAVVVAEAALLSGWDVVGVFDDRADCPVSTLVPHLGPLLRDMGLLRGALKDGTSAIVCVGDTTIRRRVLDGMADWTWDRAVVKHPTAYVAASTGWGGGVFVAPHAVVHSRAVVEHHAIINTGAIIEHDCRVGENTHVAPGAVVAGACTLGRDVLIGVGARLVPGITVGDGAVVGAGAVVLGDVAPGSTVAGVPARGLTRH